MSRKRIDKDTYYLNIAVEVAKRGTCLRRNYGAVIVNNDEIISTGYTGAPRGVPNCIDIGNCLREDLQIPSGTRYELCRSVHAEMNAMIHAARRNVIGGKLYLMQATGDIARPCKLCTRVIINSGITLVISRNGTGRSPVIVWTKEDGVINENP